MKKEIKNIIKNIIKEEWQVENLPDFSVGIPEEEKFGHRFTNAALILAKILKKAPLEIAQEICVVINERHGNLFEKAEAVAPGFVNLFLSKEYLFEEIKEIIEKGEKYGDSEMGKGKKIQVEFISANPTGPLTLGNGRGGFLGDCLANVFNKAGFEAEREYYVNDVGEQINKLGHSVLEDEQAVYKGEYIKLLKEKIEAGEAGETGRKAAEIVLNEMLRPIIENGMKINFNNYFSEKSLFDSGEVEKVLNYLKEKELAYEKEGALWFATTKFGDDKDRVLIKSDGEKTYLVSDIAYHKNKFERGFDKVIDIWGADHHGYVGRMKAAVQALGYGPEQLEVIIIQLVRLIEGGKEVRMSKRAGTYVTIEELLEDLDKHTKRVEGETGPNGLDIARYFFLSYSADAHMNFDLDLARKQTDDNPVYYIQYAHARMSSILRNETDELKNIAPDFSLLSHPSEISLMERLSRFQEFIIEETALDYKAHRLPKQAYELAASFNGFYRDCRVLDEENAALSAARLALVKAAKTVLKEMLRLMGITAPEKM